MLCDLPCALHFGCPGPPVPCLWPCLWPCLGPACALLISPYELLCCHELFSPCTHLRCAACLCLWAALPVACMCPACAAWAACALLLLHWTAVRCAVAECSCAVLHAQCAELFLSVLTCSCAVLQCAALSCSAVLPVPCLGPAWALRAHAVWPRRLPSPCPGPRCPAHTSTPSCAAASVQHLGPRACPCTPSPYQPPPMGGGATLVHIYRGARQGVTDPGHLGLQSRLYPYVL